MTTFIPFQPSATQNFTVNVTLDGLPYVLIVTWSLFGNRWYINILTPQGVIVVQSYPLVGSPDDYDINLLTAWFTTSTMVFRESTNQFEINP